MTEKQPATGMSDSDAAYAMLPADAAAIARELRLEPLPHEGGLFRNTLATPDSTAIYFMVAGDDFSALHRLETPEVYHWYAGSPLEILVLHPDGSGEEVRLGPDIHAGDRPQRVIPGGVFHGSRSTGAWSLVGTTMAPPFAWERFTLGTAAQLCASHPEYAAKIRTLTRE